jgi:ATP-dependent helicase/nuclease subunit A
MTVHASKGLEARVVFLIDTFHNPKGGSGPKLLEIEDGAPGLAVWVRGEKHDPPPLEPARARYNGQALAESRRLLYVALTRARDRLYICGAKPQTKPADGHWRGIIDAALDGHDLCCEAPCEHGSDPVKQWRKPGWRAAPPADRVVALGTSDLPAWLRTPAQPDLPRPAPLRPSRLADAAEPPALTEAIAAKSAARLRGELVHHLLQHLPGVAAERRAEAAVRLAAARFPALDAAARSEAIAAVQALMVDPVCAGLFDGDGRAEVEIAGKVRIGGRLAEVAGRIDRLAVGPDQATLVDFKTGRPPRDPADVPERHLRQLAIYEALLRDLYPERDIRSVVVWTALPLAVTVPSERLAAAMAAITLP